LVPLSTRDVAVIIPAFNAADTIERCVRSALEQSSAIAEVVVIDNASTDETARLAQDAGARVVFEAIPGRSRARNRGADETHARVMWFMDADCEAPPDWVERSLSLIREPWLAAVQSSVQKSVDRAPSRRFSQAHYYWPFLDTCALMVTREAFGAAGGFDETLPRNEDMDFSFRLLASGFAFGWQPDTIMRKVHQLTHPQALRRGWIGGGSLGLADNKWRHELGVRRRRFAFDLAKGVVKAAAREVLPTGSTRGTLLLEAGARFAGALRGLASPSSPTRRRVVTQLPHFLGERRFPVFGPNGALLYDAVRKQVLELSEERSAELSRYLAGEELAPAELAQLRRALDLPAI
jgi:hypothetical protein